MSTVVKIEYRGEWLIVPQSEREAKTLGWYIGLDNLQNKHHIIKKWCYETFNSPFKIFDRSVWFYGEHDALLCNLRWA